MRSMKQVSFVYLLTYLYLVRIEARRANQFHQGFPLWSVLRELFCVRQGDAAVPQVLADYIKPSGAGCASGSPPSGCPRVEVEDSVGRVFLGQTLDVSKPTHAALGSEA